MKWNKLIFRGFIISLTAIQPCMNLHAMESPPDPLCPQSILHSLLSNNKFFIGLNLTNIGKCFSMSYQRSKSLLNMYFNNRGHFKDINFSKLFGSLMNFDESLKKAHLNFDKEDYGNLKIDIEEAITHMYNIIIYQQENYDEFNADRKLFNPEFVNEHIKMYSNCLSSLNGILELIDSM